MLSYKYYLDTITFTVSKHTAAVLTSYHINITLTQSHVISSSAALQLLFSHCATQHNNEAVELSYYLTFIFYGKTSAIKYENVPLKASIDLIIL